MAPIWSKQPFKMLYTAHYLLTTLISLPWLLLRYALPPTRPFLVWSLRYCILNAIGRGIFVFFTKTRADGMSTVISDHKKAGARYALVEPAEPGVYSGILTPGRRTVPSPVGGLWYPQPLLATSPDLKTAKVVLHVPGGAFVRAYGQEFWGEPVSNAILNFSPATYVFFAQHRVSSDDATRFPAALQDVLTFYHYLLRQGIEPRNIVLSGDSSGANLVIGLLRYLEETQDTAASLPLPSGVMLWSPWVHVTRQAGADFESHKNAANDCIVAPILQWGADAYFPRLPSEPSTEELAYISPLGDPFHSRVPVFIHGGTAEGFYDKIREFASKMGGVDGNRVRFHSTDFTTHNLIMAYAGWESKMEAALKDAYHFFLS